MSTTQSNITPPITTHQNFLLKLIKYDLKYTLKSILFFGSLLIVCALLFNITCYDHDFKTYQPNALFIIQLLHTIFYNGIFILVIALIINCIARIWHRYRSSFFGDEAYLIHTLPIKRSTLWLSKFLSTVFTLASALLTIVLSFLILGLTKDGQLLVNVFGIKFHNFDALFSIAYILTILTQLLYMVMCGFVGITLSNRHGRSHTRKSIIFGFVVYILGVGIMLGCLLLQSCVDQGLHTMIFGTPADLHSQNLFTLSLVARILLSASAFYIIAIAILYGTNQALLKKGINLD